MRFSVYALRRLRYSVGMSRRNTWPKPLTAECERELLEAAILRGDIAARQLLVVHNMRFIDKCAWTYLTRRRRQVPVHWEDFDDLVQEGAMYLWECVPKFDLTMTNRFLTFIGKYLWREFDRAFDAFAPVTRTVVESTTFRREWNAAGHAISIYSQTRGSSGSEAGNHAMQLCDMIVDETADDPCQASDLDVLFERMHDEVQRLPERQKIIVRMRSQGQTLDEIGQLYGVTKERVRQIEANALRKLFDRLQQFADCLNDD